MLGYENCALCPRKCYVNRLAGERGYCGCPGEALVAKAMLHPWEEPCLSPAGRSGAIFFGGCALQCSYCQNFAISRAPRGEPMDAAALRRQMEALIAAGAENIDLVTASQYLPTVLEALRPRLGVPVVYNCGGYERVRALRALEGRVQIYLPDLKYADSALAASLSGAPDYFEVASAAIREMVRQTGSLRFEGERLVRGTLVRHLILPGQIENSLRVLDWLGESFPRGQVLVSLMRQYTPLPGLRAPFDRAVTDEEYDAVLSWMLLNRLPGYVQEAGSAGESYIPAF